MRFKDHIFIAIFVISTSSFPSANENPKSYTHNRLDIGGITEYRSHKETFKQSPPTWNASEFRKTKLKECAGLPIFFSARYGQSEGMDFGEFIRIAFKISSNGAVSGILKFQSPERGHYSYFNEIVTNNISGDFLRKLTLKKTLTGEDFQQSDRYFVHVFTLKGTANASGAFTFKTMAVAFDDNYETRSYSFTGIKYTVGSSEFVRGTLTQQNKVSFGSRPFVEKIDIESPIIR